MVSAAGFAISTLLYAVARDLPCLDSPVIIFVAFACRRGFCIVDFTAKMTSMTESASDPSSPTSPDAAPTTQAGGIVVRLSIMMFLQFFAWGTWFATLSAAMDAGELGDFIGGAYASAPIAAIIAPLFLGLVADRLFSSEKVFGVLMLIGGAILLAVPGVAAGGAANGDLLVWLILGHLLCYMPTLGLGNTIAFTHIPSQEHFPKIRVWGTIGWIVAGLTVGLMGWTSSFNILMLGAGRALLM